jgi:long-chain acyl-CoA synthetase
MLQRVGAGSILPATLLATLATRGAAPAVTTIEGEAARDWPAAGLAEEGMRLARALLAEGVRPQEPVAIFAPNSPRWVAARLGIGASGALPFAIDDLSTPLEVATILRDADPRWVFTTAQHAATMRDAIGERRVVALDGPEFEALTATAPDVALPGIGADAPSMVVYTSGTTGNPKSFALTHANLEANLEGVLRQGLVGPTDRMLLPLPMHHVYPWLIGVLTPLASGAGLVLPQGVTGPQLTAALRLGRVSVLVGVPRLYTALLAGLEGRVAARGPLALRLFRTMLAASVALRKREIHVGKRLFGALHRQLGPELRIMVSGGAKLEPQFVLTLEALGWRLLSGYGLAETASMFTGNVPGAQRIGSEGRPIAAGSELRIAEPDAEGQGEIQLKGPNVFAGYRNNPEANAAAFSADGWFRTGDLGRVDAEGFVTITGRLKEMIVLGGGKNVFPEELERHYGKLPLVQEIAVLERAGALVAIVVPDMAAARAGHVLRVEDQLRVDLAAAAQALPSFQRLSGFVIAREPLPRTRLGKYPRFRLGAIHDALKAGAPASGPAPLSAEDHALVARPGAREVWAVLTRRYADKPLSPESNPALDLGIDSLEWVTLGLEIEGASGIRLTEEEMAGFASIRELLLRAAEGPKEAPSPPSGAEVAALIRPPPPALRPVRHLAWLAARGTARGLFSLTATGVEHVPASGPFVIVCNHVSDLDPGLVATALPRAIAWRLWFSGTTDRLFRGPVSRGAARALQIFPVDDRQPARAVATARAVLARGEALLWFPESWRSPDGAIQRFLPGIGLILDGLEVPVVPARVFGAFEAMPRNRRLPRRHPVRVVFGAPLSPAALAEGAEGAARAPRIAERLQQAVAALG